MNIEEFIRNNKNEFDSEEPSENHYENFNKKLGSKFKREARLLPLLRIASVAILLILSSLWIVQNFIIDEQIVSIAKLNLSDLSSDYNEVEMFFTAGINSSLEELANLGSEGERIKHEMVESEFKELDSTYELLQAELAMQPDDERIIDAMIGYYQTKQNILNNILTQLKHAKNLNPNNHDTYQV